MKVLPILFCMWASVAATGATAAPGDPPMGYKQLCRERPLFCMADRAVREEDDPHPFAISVFFELTEVNTKWNTTILPVKDTKEDWSASTQSGDCEEFAIAKKMELLQRGYSASQLLLTMVESSPSEAHLILVVRTTWGNFVLDNLNQHVLLWEAANYTLHSRQREDGPSLWTTASLH